MKTDKVNRDKLSALNGKRVASAAFAALSGIQSHEPEEIVAGLAVAAIEAARHYGLDAPDPLYTAERLIAADAKTFQHFRAVRAFMAQEL
jgi:hypothetical protein